jgi:steroid 5-alpha reductase family enzyme
MENNLLNLFAGDIQIAHIAQTWIVLMLVVTLVCFIVSEITRNYSQVDKLWSLMPIAYAGITLAAFPHSPRLWLMTILVAAWGLRLSYNFSRKGGYNKIPWRGEEDYRWKIMRDQPALNGRFRFGIFNLLLISFYQQFLIMLFSTPLLLAAQFNDKPFSIYDAIPAFFMAVFIITETIADNQLFSFQQQKKNHRPKETRFEESLRKGFISQGLFSNVRHPNFASEQAIWLSFYFFSVTASGDWLNWTAIGVLLLILIFQGSSVLTENISCNKYPEYVAYQKTVPRFIPNPFRRR